MTRPTAGSVDPIDTDTERTPLLAGTPTPTASAPARPLPPRQRTDEDADDEGDYDDHDDEDATSSHTAGAANNLRALLRPRVILLSLALIFLLELAIGMAVPPINAIMESIICRQMHPDVFLPPPPPPRQPVPITPGTGVLPPLHNGSSSSFLDFGLVSAAAAVGRLRHYAGGIVLSDDPVCKEPDVQGYLAMLRGWAATFDCIPGIVGVVPFGILSDRWGRRPVMALSLAGIVASVAFTYLVFYFSNVVPLWVMWLSAGFQLVGGGSAVFVAMLYTTIADVVPSEERATVFFQVTAIFLGSQMLAGPLGGAMLIWNPWIPLLVALAILIICNLGVLGFPETVHVHDGKTTGDEQQTDSGGIPMATKLWQKARASLAEVLEFVLGNRNLAFLMLSLTFVILGRFVGELLLQYATARYHWSWSTASMVLTIRNAGSLVTLLAVLPIGSWLCTEYLGMTGVAKDLWLARCSGAIHIFASLTIAAAANGTLFSFGLAWYALGSGMSALIRSLLNALVEDHHVGTVNSLVGFMEMVGTTAAGPLLAKSLSVGLNLGGAWVGLPFLTAGLFFVISTGILCIFRLANVRRPSCVESLC